MLLCSLCRSPEAQKVSLGLPVGNCLASAQSRVKAIQDLACGSECAQPRAAAVLDLSQPRKRPACLDLGGGKFSRVGSGAFSSGLSFHPGGFSLVPGFRALLPGRSSCAAANVVRSVSPLLGPVGVSTGSVGVVACVPGPVVPPVVPAVVPAGPLGIPARYASAMAEIEETISHAWDPATVKRREKLMLELAGWLGESGLGCSLADCSPTTCCCSLSCIGCWPIGALACVMAVWWLPGVPCPVLSSTYPLA